MIARAFDAKGGPALDETIYRLPANRVFEDLLPRLIDLDQDGRDEIVLVESDPLCGSSLVALGLRAASGSAGAAAARFTELARSPDTGSSFRWLNPAGTADFDGDGRLDLAAVIAPHVGGELTLYHYRPPRLMPFATTADVSSRRLGTTERQLAATVQQAGRHPAIIVPDMTLQALRAFRWFAPGVWREPADTAPLPSRASRIPP